MHRLLLCTRYVPYMPYGIQRAIRFLLAAFRMLRAGNVCVCTIGARQLDDAVHRLVPSASLDVRFPNGREGQDVSNVVLSLNLYDVKYPLILYINDITCRKEC